MTDDDDIREKVSKVFRARPGPIERLRLIVLSVPGVKEAVIREFPTPNIVPGTIEIQIADVFQEAPEDLKAEVTALLTPHLPLTVQFRVVGMYADEPVLLEELTSQQHVTPAALDDRGTESPDDPNYGSCYHCGKEAILTPDDLFCPACDKTDKCPHCFMGEVESGIICLRCGGCCTTIPCPDCRGPNEQVLP